MSTLAEYMIVTGADNRPPMLDKPQYESWKSRIEFYMQGKDHGRMILNSVENGPMIWPNVTLEDGTTVRPKSYEELSEQEKLHNTCDLKAANIVLQGLPPDVYALVNHHKVVKEIWDRVRLLMLGTSLSKQERECKLYDEFDKFTHVKGETLYTYYLRFAQLINDLNTINMTMQTVQVNTKFLNSLLHEWGKFVTDVKLVRDLHTSNFDQLYGYLKQHEIHANETRIMRERYPDPLALSFYKWSQDFLFQRFFKEKHDPIAMLKQSKCKGSKVKMSSGTLDFKVQFLPTDQGKFNRTSKNCEVLQLSRDGAYGQTMYYAKEETRCCMETQQASVPNTDTSAQQNSLIMSIFEQISSHATSWDSTNKENKLVNESLTAELDRYRERVKILEQRINVDLSTREKFIDLQMDDMIRNRNTFSNLEQHCISLEIAMQLSQEIFQKDISYTNQSNYDLQEYFEFNDLKAQLQARDTVITALKEKFKVLRDNPDKVKKDIDMIETANIELENSVAKLLSENEHLHKEIKHLKKVFNDQFDSIKKTHVSTKEHNDSMIDQMKSKSLENDDLKVQLQEKGFANATLKNELRKLKGKDVVDTASSKPKAITIAPGMFKIKTEPLAPKLLKNKDAHIDYIQHSRKHADVLQEIVEDARALSPLDCNLDYACKYAQRIQEVLVYVHDSCPCLTTPRERLITVTPKNKDNKVRPIEPVTSSKHSSKLVVVTPINKDKQVCITQAPESKDSNPHLLHSTRVICSTSACESKPSGNAKKYKISQSSSSKKTNNVEDQPRDVKSKMNKKNRVVQICLWCVNSGWSKHMTGNLKLLISFIWKFLGTVRFGNDHVAAILDLEAPFRRNTCFVRNLEGDDLITKSWITCDNTNRNTTLSEAQGVSLRITSDVRELYTTFSALAGKLRWRGRSWVFDLNKSDLFPSFIEGLNMKVSLSEAWTRFKDLLQKVPHYGIDLWLQVQIFYDHVNPVTRQTINQSASGKLHDRNAKESWALYEDLALYDKEIWNDPRDFAKPVKAIALPQDVPSTSDRHLREIENRVQCLMEAHLAPTQPTQVNKVTTSCEICSSPHDTQYYMEYPEQAFVEYASSHTGEAGDLEALVSNFMASQDARLAKFEPDFKQQQSEMTNKIVTVLKAITDRIAGALPSHTVKNPKLSTSPVLSAHSYPTIDPKCSSHPSTSINAIKAYSKEANIFQTSLPQTGMGIETQQLKEPELTLEDEL
ncbi:hypothetical protein Tco_0534211 [Tanacetum coccineum]